MSSFIGCFKKEDLQNKFSTEQGFYNQISNSLLVNGVCSVFNTNEEQIILFGHIYNIEKVANEENIINFTSDAHFFLELFNKDYKLIRKLDGEFTAIIFSKDQCNVIRDRHGAFLTVEEAIC